MKISIAMATFNGERHLAEQLKSLADQTLLPAELVVSDDGSSDATLTILHAFSRRAPFPVRLLEPSVRLGFADNFLRCAEMCMHDLVAFCDQDDVWRPEKLELMQTRLVRDNSQLAMHRLIISDERLRPLSLFAQDIDGDAVFEPLALDPYKTGWGNTMLFRRSLVLTFDRQRRPRQPESNDRPLSHDQWVYLLAAALGRVSHSTAPLILYRQHATNVMGYQAKQSSFTSAITERLHAMRRIKERYDFYIAVAECFDSASRNPLLAEASARAAARYRERASTLMRRLNIYYGNSLRQRTHAFFTFFNSHGYGTLSPLACLKDLCLGVTGILSR